MISSKKISAAADHAMFGGAFGRPEEIYLQKVVGWRWGKSTGGWEWNDATSKCLRHYFVDQDFALFMMKLSEECTYMTSISKP